MSYTTYLRLTKPPFDSIPWDQAINGDLDIIDSFAAQYMNVANFAGTWRNSTAYVVGQVLLDASSASMWQCAVSHTSAPAPTTFSLDRAAHPTYWTNTTIAPPPQITANTGRNLLHNPMFNIQQRGVGPFTVNGNYTADRWQLSFSGDTGVSVLLTPASDGIRSVVADEACTTFLSVAFTGNSAPSSFTEVTQAIENVRRLSGKTITISFWAWCSTGALKLGVAGYQFFGTGGSPSAPAGLPITVVQLSAGVTYYNFTITVPSIAGKVFGTSGTDYTMLQFVMSGGSAAFGAVGVQAGTINIWGVQLEVGIAPTPLEKLDPRNDLANCQRFFAQVEGYYGGYQVAGGAISSSIMLPVQMRASPAVVPISQAGSANITGSVTVGVLSSRALFTYATVTATGTGTVQVVATASADF